MKLPGVLMISCLDPRCVPEKFFDLKTGGQLYSSAPQSVPNSADMDLPTEAGVIRNAGGQVKPVLRDILIADFLLGIREIVLVHHTDCGTTKYRDEQIRASLKERLPDHAKEIDGMDFGGVKE
jgi:carbonic anhydrase